MTKIEFLSASLPYALKCQVDNPYDYTIVGINLGHVPFITIHGEFTGSLHCENFDVCTPVIRHLDTLSKECVQADYNNGDPFIPIVELARIAKIVPDIERSVILKSDNGIYIDGYDFRFILGDFSLVYRHGDTITIDYQFQLFQHLLRWHFWLNKPEGEEVVYVTEEFNPYK